MSAPAAKSIEQINSADQDDAALQAYKASLLGGAIGADGKGVAKYPDDKRKVIVESVKIVFDDETAPKRELTLVSDSTVVIKEGTTFTTFVTFYVQHDIALGLKVTNTTTKMGVTVDTDSAMLGSFAPKLEPYCVRAVASEAPSGFLGRTTFNFISLLHDDDKNEYNTFKCTISIKSGWE
jgi:Rho GDP-dissociation inhibitor